MPVITGDDLVSYPGITGTSADLESYATAASELVEEAWANPVTPAPLWVVNIAKAVAARAFWNPKGLEMLSRQVDDAKRTETYGKDYAGRVGFYLTDAERSELGGFVAGVGVRSIRTAPRGWC